MQDFEKRLKYERYKNMNNIITIDLHNDYSVIAFIRRDDEETYSVELKLKENSVNKWESIEDGDLIFEATPRTIHSAILKTVDKLLHDGFFDYYIERYEYGLKCFDIGNSIEEEKRLACTTTCRAD